MNDFEKYLQRKALSKATIKTYNTETLHFITWCDIENIEVENCSITEVTSYLKRSQNKGLDNKTRAMQVYILKHFFTIK